MTSYTRRIAVVCTVPGRSTSPDTVTSNVRGATTVMVASANLNTSRARSDTRRCASSRVRLRRAASVGCIKSGGALREAARSPSVEEMRLSEAGEISIRGPATSRSRQAGSKAAAPQRSAKASDLSSILPDGVAGKRLS